MKFYDYHHVYRGAMKQEVKKEETKTFPMQFLQQRQYCRTKEPFCESYIVHYVITGTIYFLESDGKKEECFVL